MNAITATVRRVRRGVAPAPFSPTRRLAASPRAQAAVRRSLTTTGVGDAGRGRLAARRRRPGRPPPGGPGYALPSRSGCAGWCPPPAPACRRCQTRGLVTASPAASVWATSCWLARRTSDTMCWLSPVWRATCLTRSVRYIVITSSRFVIFSYRSNSLTALSTAIQAVLLAWRRAAAGRKGGSLVKNPAAGGTDGGDRDTSGRDDRRHCGSRG